MGDELALYKQKRVLEFQTNYSVKLSLLNSTLNSAIRNLQSNRRLPLKIKINIINTNK